MGLEELKKLNPEERIKRLKKLEKERKQELEEADKMIKASQKEIEEDFIRKIRAPEPEEVEIGRLFRRRDEPEEERLEEAVKSSPLVPDQQSQYEIHKLEDTFKERSTKDVYNAVADLMGKDSADMNPYEKHKVEAAYHIIKDRQERYDSSGQKFRNETNAVMSLHARIMQDYNR